MSAPETPPAHRPAHVDVVKGKQGPRRLLLFFGGALALLLGAALLVIVLVSPGEPEPPCPEDVEVCGVPPTGPPLVKGKIWKSASGVQMEYYPNVWKVVEETADSIRLSQNNADVTLWVKAVPAAEANPGELLDERLDSLGDDFLGLKEDPDPSRKLLNPSVGYVDGIGAAYGGTTDTPQGPGSPVLALVMAATDERASVVVSAVSTAIDERHAFGNADTLLNTLRWPSTPPPGGAT